MDWSQKFLQLRTQTMKKRLNYCIHMITNELDSERVTHRHPSQYLLQDSIIQSSFD